MTECVRSHCPVCAGERSGVRQAFVLPEGYDLLAVVTFGYHKRKLGLGRKNRKPIGEVVSDEKFGVPWKV